MDQLSREVSVGGESGMSAMGEGGGVGGRGGELDETPRATGLPGGAGIYGLGADITDYGSDFGATGQPPKLNESSMSNPRERKAPLVDRGS